MLIYEFLMLCCFGFSWPFSIAETLKTKSAKGKSLGFMALLEMGYIFGIVHKIMYDYNWVLWVYVAIALLIALDISLYFYYSGLDGDSSKNG